MSSLDIISRYEKECNKHLTKTDYIKEDNVLYYDDELPVFNQKELNNLALGNIIKGDIKSACDLGSERCCEWFSTECQ